MTGLSLWTIFAVAMIYLAVLLTLLLAMFALIYVIARAWSRHR